MSQQDASATHPYRGLVLDTCALAACPDVLIYWVEPRTVGWPHVRTDELGCLTAQKLDCHKHAVLAHCLAGRQTCLQQSCGSLVVASASATRLGNIARWVYCSRFNEDEVGTAEFGYCKSARIVCQSGMRTSCRSVVLRQWLNFSRAWWNATSPSVRWKSLAFYKVVRWHFSGVMGKVVTVCFLLR